MLFNQIFQILYIINVRFYTILSYWCIINQKSCMLKTGKYFILKYIKFPKNHFLVWIYWNQWISFFKFYTSLIEYVFSVLFRYRKDRKIKERMQSIFHFFRFQVHKSRYFISSCLSILIVSIYFSIYLPIYINLSICKQCVYVYVQACMCVFYIFQCIVLILKKYFYRILIFCISKSLILSLKPILSVCNIIKICLAHMQKAMSYIFHMLAT